MKKLMLLLYIIIPLISCKEDTIKQDVSFDKLVGKLLVYKEGRIGGQVVSKPDVPVGKLFNVYINGIEFLDNNRFELYFFRHQHNHEQQNHNNVEFNKLEFTSELRWRKEDKAVHIIVPTVEPDSTIWHIEEITDSTLVVKEIYENKELMYFLEVLH